MENEEYDYQQLSPIIALKDVTWQHYSAMYRKPNELTSLLTALCPLALVSLYDGCRDTYKHVMIEDEDKR